MTRTPGYAGTMLAPVAWTDKDEAPPDRETASGQLPLILEPAKDRPTFTVYRIKDPATGKAFYIGQTRRMWSRKLAHLKDAKPSRKAIYMRSLLAAGQTPLFETLHEVQSRQEALRLERLEIALHIAQGCALFNGNSLRWAHAVLTAELADAQKVPP